MSRIAAGIAVSASVLMFTGNVSADHHHKEWWNFLKGEWTYEISPLDIKGTATWRLTAKRSALQGRFVQDDGTTSIELSGWHPDTKTLVANGYGSAGNYWHLEFPKITDEMLEGTTHGVFPDGRSYKGTFTGKRVDDNHYEFHIKAKTRDGDEITTVGKFTRKTE